MQLEQNQQGSNLPQTTTPNYPLSSKVKSEVVILHKTNPTIGQIHPDDLYDPLVDVVIAISQRIGIKASKLEVQDVMRFITKFYKDFTLPEITNAWDLLAAQKIEAKDSFGMLSLEYIGGVLNAARKFRIDETKKEQTAHGTLDDNQTRILTPEEHEELNFKSMKEGCIQAWEHFNEHNQMMFPPSMDFVSNHYHDFMRAQQIMERTEGDERKAIETEAEKFIENELKVKQANATRTEMKTIGNALKAIRGTIKFENTCKKIAVRVFFENAMMEGIDLTAKLNEL